MDNQFNFDGMPRLQAAIQALEELIPQVVNFGGSAIEVTGQTGVPTLMANGKEVNNTMEAFTTMLKGFIGEDGDNLTGNGTLKGVYGAAKSIERAMGGNA